VLSRPYVILYNGKYYFDTSDVGAEFIEARLSEYENWHGEKMSVKTFFSLFPRIRDKYDRCLYEITERIPDSGKDEYKKTFQLKDGSVSVLYLWHKEPFLVFMRMTGFPCNYYENY
jgi:hypothetical protein